MPACLIADVRVNDDSWLPEYAAMVHDLAAKHGGRYLSRSANFTHLEGESLHTTVIALSEFPSVEAAQAFAGDPEYAPYREARIAGTVSKLNVIDDTDAAWAIPCLPKA